MSTTPDFIEFVCEQIRDVGEVRYKKMFGEYKINNFFKEGKQCRIS
jgi:TfoX/Sxy family transcriptional regulator of competence genes